MAISILDIDPLNGSIGVPTDKVIRVIFDKPIDLTTLDNGNVFIAGEGKDHIGSPFRPLVEAEERYVNNPLEDPAYQGIVIAYHTAYYLSTDSSTKSTSFRDTSATDVYYTQIVVTPKRPLEPTSNYTIYLSGQQYTNIPAGISRRTVFDPYPGAGNSGTWSLYTFGGFSGAANSVYDVEILTSGVIGSGKYRWRKNAGIYSGTRTIHANKQSLGDGVDIAFDLEGSYSAGDSYSFITQTSSWMSGIAISTFVTGAYGSSIDLSNLTTTHISQTASPSPPGSPGSVGPNFYIKYTVFKNYDEIGTDTTNIVFHFNKALSTAFDSNGIKLYQGPIASPDCTDTEATSYFMNNVVISGTKATIYFENT